MKHWNSFALRVNYSREQSTISMEPMEETAMDTTEKSIIPGYASINDFSQKSLKAVLQATKSSNNLPVGDDYDFYSTFSSVRDVMDVEGGRILSLLQRILRYQNVKGNIGPGQSSTMDLEERFDVLMDANDQILERVGTLLDEASGVKKQEAKLVLASAPRPKVSTSWNKKVLTPTSAAKPANAYRLLTGRNILRPQVRFKDKIDNSNTPFKPLLREKPNALKSLEDSLKLQDTVTIEESEDPQFVHSNPYAFELEEFSPGFELLTKVKPQEPQPVSLTPLIFVDKPDQLHKLLEDLQCQEIIAVDLEHHSYRSFQGITCLMQVSTRSHDYIVDVIEVRDEMHIFNKVFTDPKITKIFHGADSDINWLQHDFGLYVVNMFDTSQAARVLGLPRFSLAHLLMHYCHVQADKQFQLADWRIRPLPAELINYAREDTHYLLYIYDLMRNQLLDSGNNQANLLHSVYSRSKLVASQAYRKPVYSESDFLELYQKSRKVFNNQQLAALQDLYRWRDQMARMEDESLGYVLPNHMLLQIAEILPREHQGVLACCNPIPPLVRQNLPELHKMVFRAREIALAKVEKTIGSQPSVAQHPKYDVDSLLNCRHDMTRQGDTIVDIEQNIAASGLIADIQKLVDMEVLQTPMISAFSHSNKTQNTLKSTKALVENIRAHFANPFTKFLAKETSGNVVEPLRQHMWLLKCATSKRKLDRDEAKVDLDSFEPEYTPPTKRPKVTVNLTAPPISTANTSGKSKSIFGIPDTTSNTSDDKSSKDNIKDKITSRLQTLRDEVYKAKKKLKQAEEDKKKKNEPTLDADLNVNDNNSTRAKTDEKTGKKTVSNNTGKKTKENTDNNSNSTMEKTKKKKKKQKGDKCVAEEFTGFDYEAVEKQMKIEASKTKKMDVYNPRLPSRDKKKGKNKNKNAKGDKSKRKGKGNEEGNN